MSEIRDTDELVDAGETNETESPATEVVNEDGSTVKEVVNEEDELVPEESPAELVPAGD